MINLQMQGHAVVLGSSGWKDLVQPEALQNRCACCGDSLHLSDEEVLADFLVLDSREAYVEGWLQEEIVQAKRTIMDGLQLALIRWKDGVESLVVFPAGDGVPSADVLMAAYWNGYSTDHVSRYLDAELGSP